MSGEKSKNKMTSEMSGEKSKNKMTSEKFRNNIWLQLVFLIVLAALCGTLIGGVALLVKNKSGEGGLTFYEELYKPGLIYTEDTNFVAISDKFVAGSASGTIDATLKVNVSDGATLVKVKALSRRVDLVMYVIVKDGAAQTIYFESYGETWMGKPGGAQYPIANNRLTVSEFNLIAGSTHTFNALTKTIEIAIKA